MSDEIKEKNIIQKSIQCLSSAKLETTYEVARDIVLDYITNLQNTIKDHEDTIIDKKECIYALETTLNDLQQENDRLNNIINELKENNNAKD